MIGIPSCTISLDKLQAARPDNLIRLAKALKLDVRGRYHQQVARMVYNRINTVTSRFEDEAKKADYLAMWEKL